MTGYGQLCVYQITEMLGLATATVSRHMSVLQKGQLIKKQKETWIPLPRKTEQSRGRSPEMSIKLHLPGRFYYLWEGKEVLDVTGKTVAECLDDLVRLIPVLKKALFYETEKALLLPTIKVLVNKEKADAEGLAKKVKDGDEIRIMLKGH